MWLLHILILCCWTVCPFAFVCCLFACRHAEKNSLPRCVEEFQVIKRNSSRSRINQNVLKLTVSVVDMEETLWNLVLETEDCLLSTGSLKEESLCDADIQSLLGAWDRKWRQGTFSARVSLLEKNNDLQNSPDIKRWVTEWLDGRAHLYFEWMIA